jgi:hypothetical protein
MAGRPGFNVAQFKAFIGDRTFLRPNKFLVKFAVPACMQSSVSSVNNADFKQSIKEIEFWCEAANVPGIALQAHEVRRYGYGATEKRPVTALFNDVQFSFYGDSDAKYWALFQQWIKKIVNYDMREGISGKTGFNSSTPYEIAYKHEYVSDITLYVYDDTGNAKIAVTLREAWPMFVGDAPLNWGDTNSIMRVPVTITFTDWFNQDIVDSPPSSNTG